MTRKPFTCERCGHGANGLRVCNVCHEWRGPCCLEKESTPKGWIYVCTVCQTERRHAHGRDPHAPKCEICWYPMTEGSVCSQDDGCKRVQRPGAGDENDVTAKIRRA